MTSWEASSDFTEIQFYYADEILLISILSQKWEKRFWFHQFLIKACWLLQSLCCMCWVIASHPFPSRPHNKQYYSFARLTSISFDFVARSHLFSLWTILILLVSSLITYFCLIWLKKSWIQLRLLKSQTSYYIVKLFIILRSQPPCHWKAQNIRTDPIHDLLFGMTLLLALCFVPGSVFLMPLTFDFKGLYCWALALCLHTTHHKLLQVTICFLPTRPPQPLGTVYLGSAMENNVLPLPDVT